jgi:hypothetical protein
MWIVMNIIAFILMYTGFFGYTDVALTQEDWLAGFIGANLAYLHAKALNIL